MSGDEAGNGAQEPKPYPLDVVDRITKTVDGVVVPDLFPTEYVRSAIGFRPQDEDFVLATYPKSGTTWTSFIISNLLNYEKCAEDSASVNPMEEVRFIEMSGIDGLKPGSCFKAHMVFDPKRFNPQAKHIVVMRNPRDVCVSYYHHYTMMMPGVHSKPKGFWFSTFAKLFISNSVWYGDYFEHARGWLEGPSAAGASQDKILYVTYEKMKANPREELIRIANFMGGRAAEVVKDEKAIEAILSRTSVKKMQDELNPHMGVHMRNSLSPEEAALMPDRVEFVRKGEVGDWKNHFTPEIAAEFDAWIKSNPDNDKIMKLFEV